MISLGITLSIWGTGVHTVNGTAAVPGDRGLMCGLVCSREGWSLQGQRELRQPPGTQASDLVLPSLWPRLTVWLALRWAGGRDEPALSVSLERLSLMES